MLRIALLFGSAAVALALILAPLADKYTKIADRRPRRAGFHRHRLDRGPQRLHDPPQRAAAVAGSVCIIRANGQRSGDC